MTAERLRQAAEALRTAEQIDRGRWEAIPEHERMAISVVHRDEFTDLGLVGTLCKASVALALADLLDVTALWFLADLKGVPIEDIAEFTAGWFASEPALAVADVILGEA